MLARCEDPTNKRYKDYGGRGITVCKRWRLFESFVADMGYPPDGCQTDRIENNKGYSPDNCKWSTRKEQQNNRRGNKLIEFKGERKTLTQWSEELGINKSTLSKRLGRSQWNIEEALSVVVEPHTKYRPKRRA